MNLYLAILFRKQTLSVKISRGSGCQMEMRDNRLGTKLCKLVNLSGFNSPPLVGKNGKLFLKPVHRSMRRGVVHRENHPYIMKCSGNKKSELHSFGS